MSNWIYIGDIVSQQSSGLIVIAAPAVAGPALSAGELVFVASRPKRHFERLRGFGQVASTSAGSLTWTLKDVERELGPDFLGPEELASFVEYTAGRFVVLAGSTILSEEVRVSRPRGSGTVELGGMKFPLHPIYVNALAGLKEGYTRIHANGDLHNAIHRAISG